MKRLTIETIENSQWDYPEIEQNLLYQIKENNNDNCMKIIKKYEKILSDYLKGGENKHVKEFLKKLNYIFVNTEYIKEFYAAQNVLNNEIFSEVLTKFNESDVLIRACRKRNKNTIRWLLEKTNINVCVTDEKGRTALMYASEHWILVFFVEQLLLKNKDSAFFSDNEGNTALYHSIHCFNNFNRILYTIKDMDHLNNNLETIIYYCGKNNVYFRFDTLFQIPNLNIKITPEIFIEEGKRVFPKLVQDGNDALLKYLATQYLAISSTLDINILKCIINDISDTLLTIITKNYYDAYMSGDKDTISNYVRMLKVLIFDLECNINSVIDEEGNTLLMFFLLIEDYTSTNYILSSKPDIDLSIKNKRNVNASYLSLFIKNEEKDLRMKLIDHPSFDNFFLDENKDNLITHFIIRGAYEEALKILSKSKYLLTVPNLNGENTISIAIKSGHSDVLQDLFFKNEGFNQQDQLGNTPLHYAIELKDEYAIILLAYYGADTTIKNKEDKTPMDLANELNDPRILELLNHPVEMLKKSQSKVKKLLSKINNKSSKDSSHSSLSSSSTSTEDTTEEEEFNHTLKKNKKLLARNTNNKYVEDYDYLLRKNKTVYSLSSNSTELSRKIKDYYFINKTILDYIPFYWTYLLSISAHNLGYYYHQSDANFTKLLMDNKGPYSKIIYLKPDSSGDYDKKYDNAYLEAKSTLFEGIAMYPHTNIYKSTKS